jgi:dTDP-4-dehydrorhamnose 3,5-epimerase
VNVLPTDLSDVLVIRPVVRTDERGFFRETWHATHYAAIGIDLPFVQDNHSHSRRGTLRGLHYQLRRPQGKLVSVVGGEIFDVAVDLRRSSATFGHWAGAALSDSNQYQLWVPPGFAHGFYVLSASVDVLYKCTEFYSADDEATLSWNDPRPPRPCSSPVAVASWALRCSPRRRQAGAWSPAGLMSST